MINVGVPIAQGAAPHGAHVLGDASKSTRTIAQAGCMLCSLTMAARALTGRPSLSPLDAQGLIDQQDGFAGPGLIMERAARALGLVEGERGPFDLDEVRGDLALGRPVMLGIDYLPGHSSGFSSADHFVLAVDVTEDGTLWIADPATGRVDPLATASTRYHGHDAAIVEQIRFTPRAV